MSGLQLRNHYDHLEMVYRKIIALFINIVPENYFSHKDNIDD